MTSDSKQSLAALSDHPSESSDMSVNLSRSSRSSSSFRRCHRGFRNNSNNNNSINVARLLLFTTASFLVQLLGRQETAAYTVMRRTSGFGRLVRQPQHQMPQRKSLPLCKLSQLRMTSSSSKEGEFIAKQMQVSSSSSSSSTTALILEQEFREHQKRVFDDMADFFAAGETVPPEMVPVYQYLAKQILLSSTAAAAAVQKKEGGDSNNDVATTAAAAVAVVKVLDVACGAGVLWPYLAQAASSAIAGGVRIEVTGVDLSSNMVQAAAAVADTLFEDYNLYSKSNIRHTFAVVESDVLQYQPAAALSKDKSVAAAACYDLIVINASFGNFWNQTAVLEHLCSAGLLKLGAAICVTHPLGLAFVEKLHEKDAATVPHLLPASVSAWNDLALTLPLEVTDFIHPVAEINGQTNTFYMTVLRKVRARAVEQVIRLRGAVDTGYGRGGKELGFPTANLPCRLFQDALAAVPTGVYFGWAVLEGGGDGVGGRNIPHKAVVNVGYSPTFQGQENPEKIVEAHLMLADGQQLDPPDFYGETMRLQLIGYLRPEIKFPSFPDLIAQINEDVIDAKAALEKEPYVAFRSDAFLINDATWVGTNGGDIDASWEFQDVRLALGKVQ